MACIEVFGRATPGEGCTVHSFYNDGRRNQWQAMERDGAWTISGEWDHEGRPMQARCVATFSDDGRTVSCAWEYSDGGSDRRRLWDTRATRA